MEQIVPKQLQKKLFQKFHYLLEQFIPDFTLTDLAGRMPSSFSDSRHNKKLLGPFQGSIYPSVKQIHLYNISLGVALLI